MDTTTLLVLGVAVVVVIIVIGIGVFSARKDKDLVEDRLTRIENQDADAFVPSTETNETMESGNSLDLSNNAAMTALNNVLSERSFGKKWRTKLSRADLKLTVAEFFALHFLAMTGAFAMGYFVLFSGDIIFSIVLGFMGFFAPRIFVGRKISKRLRDFETQLPDTLSLWVNALRSGYSVLQSMEAISRDAPEPTSTEFKRVIQEAQLGIDLDDALAHLLDRVESPDLDLVVTAVNINREVGGNLAEILDVISGTIRERIKLRGEIRVLTSQGRATGWIISMLPIVLALFLNATNPGFMGPMFEDRFCGWPMLGTGLAMIGMGAAAIQKIVDIEI